VTNDIVRGRGRVRTCMHAGIVSCSPDAPLSEVARMMGDHRVHAIAVAEIGHGRPWGTWRIVSDMDVMAALAAGHELNAREMAATEAATVAADESLEDAAQVMSKHNVAHLVVLDSAGGYPVGIISTLDVVSAFGRGQPGAGPQATE
jgi:CBS domain-containing protein